MQLSWMFLLFLNFRIQPRPVTKGGTVGKSAH